jgi:uncharacterized protein (TIGR04255 family)
MPALALPTKLKKEPLVDALFEVRFLPTIPAVSSILPGLLLSALNASSQQPLQIERLQASELPIQMRNADPFLKYQPLLKLAGERFMLLVGDWTLTVGCKLPYAGWSELKPKIIEVMDVLKGSKLVKELERYSMKYVDIVEAKTLSEQIQRANMEIRIGSHRLAAEPFAVRIEIKQNEFANLLHVAGQAQVTLPDGNIRSGLLIDVDTVVDHRTADFDQFTLELPERLERIHTENKTRVFECLTPETIEYLEPVYDNA